MHIDQHNYEEFFLLYVDGELSAAGKQAVEQFAQANPGLAVELEMLLQMRLINDEPLVFAGKESLFKSEATGIGLHNHEEQFLLYVDNELDPVLKEKVETFVLQHPALQESFTLLKQTRLEPEALVFPDKASLYKKEENERPVFYVRWQRIAAAAVFIGFSVWIGLMLTSHKSADQNTGKLAVKNGSASQKNTERAVISSNNPASVLSKNNTPDITANKNYFATEPRIDKNNSILISPSVDSNVLNTNTLSAQNTTNAVSAGLKREDIITHPVENADKTQFSQRVPASNTALANPDLVKASHTEETDNTEPLAQQTVYKELDTEDEKKSLYLGSLEINKDKLRGFFRKAGSLFRGKAKQQEEDKAESAAPSNTRSLR